MAIVGGEYSAGDYDPKRHSPQVCTASVRELAYLHSHECPMRKVIHKTYLKCDNNPCVCGELIAQAAREGFAAQEAVVARQNEAKWERRFDSLLAKVVFGDGDDTRLKAHIKENYISRAQIAEVVSELMCKYQAKGTDSTEDYIAANYNINSWNAALESLKAKLLNNPTNHA